MMVQLLAVSRASALDGHHFLRQAMLELAEDYQLPSLSLAMGQGDAVIFAEAVGFADVEKQERATPNTVYAVASLAKPITAVGLLRLADAGTVNLDAPVSRYLDSPAYVARFSVRELAAHLAGIPHETPERQVVEFVEPRDHHSPFEALRVFDRHELLFEPGTDFEYSSNGYILLSALIESVSRRPFEAYLASEVWDPLGMAATELDRAAPGRHPQARYYTRSENAERKWEIAPTRDRTFLFGAGGFRATPSDMVRLARASYSESFLSVSARGALRNPTSLRTGKENPGHYSLGWYLDTIRLSSGTEWTVLKHAGLMEGAATAYLLVVPECHRSLAFATNTVPVGFWRLYSAMERLLAQSIDERLCRPALRSE
jgi:CubicO group peptidase (beta-lactamase class C family)